MCEINLEYTFITGLRKRDFLLSCQKETMLYFQIVSETSLLTAVKYTLHTHYFISSAVYDFFDKCVKNRYTSRLLSQYNPYYGLFPGRSIENSHRDRYAIEKFTYYIYRGFMFEHVEFAAIETSTNRRYESGKNLHASRGSINNN